MKTSIIYKGTTKEQVLKHCEYAYDYQALNENEVKCDYYTKRYLLDDLKTMKKVFKGIDYEIFKTTFIKLK